MARLLVLALAITVRPLHASEQSQATAANPVRKVVTLLQAMQKRVTDEGDKAKDLYDKYMCWCNTGKGALEASIAASDGKISQVGADLKVAKAQKTQLEEHLAQDQSDRAASKAAMADATALREKEAATFSGLKSEEDANIAALEKALAALEKGAAGGFLQTDAAHTLAKLVRMNSDMGESDRQDLLAFLSESQGYAPQSGQIIGILKQLGDELNQHLAEATAAEKAAIAAFDELMAAKKKEVVALSAGIEDKLSRIGKLGVQISQMTNDLTDTQETLLRDQTFLADMGKNCKTRVTEWQVEKNTRAEELVALADTIKVLNDDDALELFKKTLPGASSSFVQVAATTAARSGQALSILRELSGAGRTQIDLITMALAGKKIGFDKVIAMIDGMIETLKKEQLDDDDKREYCSAQLDTADDSKKALERAVSQAEASIASAEEDIATLTSEIKALEAAVKALDERVAEMTQQRKDEKAAFNELVSSNSAAKDLLNFAKNRLNKFYNPKLYIAPPTRELSEEDRINVAMGGTAPATAPPGGIAGTGITALSQVAPPPAPAQAVYEKKTKENTGVIAMIDLLIADLDKEVTEGKTSEKDAQGDYEQAMKDASEERTADSKSLTNKAGAKADLEAELQKQQDSRSANNKELSATLKYIATLHGECDWLIQYFDVRKEARAGEVDSLGKAKAVLNGADFALVQTGARGFLARPM